MHITPRHTRLAAWIALPLAVIASGAVVGTASYAAFSDTTDNAGNGWSTGTVALSDDDNGAALFDVADAAPGQTGVNCITVTADTSVRSTVKLYTADQSDPDGLADDIMMTIERGALSTPGDCSTFTTEADVVRSVPLSDLMAASDFGDGRDAWQPATGSASSTYRFAYELPAEMSNDKQDTSADTTFVWEAQSN